MTEEGHFCKCGCGNRVKCKQSTWVRGHCNKGRKRSPEEIAHWQEVVKAKGGINKGEKNGNWKGKATMPETRVLFSTYQKGKTRSEEFKKNLSEKRKGENNPNWKGKSVTEETRKKHSKNSKGKNNGNWKGGGYHNCIICNEPFWKTPKSTRKLCHNKQCKNIHQSIILSGPNGPNWRGGVSLGDYCINWDEVLKDYVKERDNHKCMNPDCWENSKLLNVHHINYNKKDCEPKNLIALCSSCNARANFDRDNWQLYYQDIMGYTYGLRYDQVSK